MAARTAWAETSAEVPWGRADKPSPASSLSRFRVAYAACRNSTSKRLVSSAESEGRPFAGLPAVTGVLSIMARIYHKYSTQRCPEQGILSRDAPGRQPWREAAAGSCVRGGGPVQ